MSTGEKSRQLASHWAHSSHSSAFFIYYFFFFCWSLVYLGCKQRKFHIREEWKTVPMRFAGQQATQCNGLPFLLVIRYPTIAIPTDQQPTKTTNRWKEGAQCERPGVWQDGSAWPGRDCGWPAVLTYQRRSETWKSCKLREKLALPRTFSTPRCGHTF